MRTEILCPGVPTLIDDTTNKPLIHYLIATDERTGNMMCDQGGCKFVYRDKDGRDHWVSNYIPATIPKPSMEQKP